jgi:transposase-like protein
MTKHSPFRHFKTSPEIIQLAVMMYVRFPLSLRNVEDLLHERGIDTSNETLRFWWNRFGPIETKASQAHIKQRNYAAFTDVVSSKLRQLRAPATNFICR